MLDKHLFDWLDKHPTERQAVLLGAAKRATRAAKLTGNIKSPTLRLWPQNYLQKTKALQYGQMVIENPAHLGPFYKGKDHIVCREQIIQSIPG